MKVSEIMTRDVEVAAPGDTRQSAAQLMADLDVGALPVADGDLVIRGVAPGAKRPSAAPSARS